VAGFVFRAFQLLIVTKVVVKCILEF
jgi:hypothetical protein